MKISISGSSGSLANFCALKIKDNKQVKNIFATGSYDKLKLIPSMQEFLANDVDCVKTFTQWENEYDKLKVGQDGILCEKDIKFIAVGGISEKLKNILFFIQDKDLGGNAIFLSKMQELDINYLIKELSSNDDISDDQIERIQLSAGYCFINKNVLSILKNVKREIVNNFFLHHIMKKNYIDESNDQQIFMVADKVKDEIFFEIRYKKQFEEYFDVNYNKYLKKQLNKEKKRLIKILQKINYVDSIVDLEKIKNIKTFNANQVPYLTHALEMHIQGCFGKPVPIEMYSIFYRQLLHEKLCCIANEEKLENILKNRLRVLYNEIMELVMHERFSIDYNIFL